MLRTIAFAQLRVENDENMIRSAPEKHRNMYYASFLNSWKTPNFEVVQIKSLSICMIDSINGKFEMFSNMSVNIESKTLIYDSRELIKICKWLNFCKILELDPEGRQPSRRQRRVLRTIAFAQLRAENYENMIKSAPEKHRNM